MYMCIHMYIYIYILDYTLFILVASFVSFIISNFTLLYIHQYFLLEKYPHAQFRKNRCYNITFDVHGETFHMPKSGIITLKTE